MPSLHTMVYIPGLRWRTLVSVRVVLRAGIIVFTSRPVISINRNQAFFNEAGCLMTKISRAGFGLAVNSFELTLPGSIIPVTGLPNLNPPNVAVPFAVVTLTLPVAPVPTIAVNYDH